MTASPDIYDILKEHTKKNRANMTEAEKFLWEHIRRKALGVKFRKQHPINDFIADFICIEKKLVIEVDGGYHSVPSQREKDELRSTIINKQGFYVIRFTNEEILMDIESVLQRLKEIIDNINS